VVAVALLVALFSPAVDGQEPKRPQLRRSKLGTEVTLSPLSIVHRMSPLRLPGAVSGFPPSGRRRPS
jgi:hypothetical protein